MSTLRQVVSSTTPRRTAGQEQTPESLLSSVMGLTAFRPGQEAIIADLLAGRDTLAVMPTGGGKSLCYQIPALMLGRLSLVVSPLISLMKDQVAALRAKGISAGAVHSGQDRSEAAKVFDELRRLNPYLLYVSPERTQSQSFVNWMKRRPLGLVAIDEAHCVSQWGHDFREDYGRLGMFKELQPTVPVLATTATATPTVVADIMAQLKLHRPARHMYGFYRPNLYYQVQSCQDEDDKQTHLAKILKSHREGRAIVYVGTRKACEELYRSLAKKVPGLAYYHAGMDHELRHRVQEQYREGTKRILIATNAFGMGVDQPDVRLVVHYHMPSNLESYYQEAGRAGRDGQPATCVLLYLKKDYGLAAYFIKESRAPRHILSNRWQALEAMVSYCESTTCRHAQILKYFGDTQRLKACGHCDVCVPQSPLRAEGARRGVLGKIQKQAKVILRRKKR